jgi:hypothetical protein
VPCSSGMRLRAKLFISKKIRWSCAETFVRLAPAPLGGVRYQRLLAKLPTTTYRPRVSRFACSAFMESPRRQLPCIARAIVSV